MILVSKPTGLRRLPISLLGLKTGTLLSRTPTLTPLLGFRPMRPADRQFAALHQLRDDCHSSMGFPHIFHVVVECADLIVPLLVDPNQIHGEINCHNVSVSLLYVEGKLGGYHDDDTIPSSFQLWHKMHSMWH